MPEILFQNAHRIFYGMALVMALIRYPRYFDTPLKYLPILLMYTFLNEMLGYLVKYNEEIRFVWADFYSTYNVVIYNVYNLIFFSYFYFVFWSYISSKKSKKFIIIGAIVLLIVSAVNLFLQNVMFSPQTYAYVFGGILLIACVFLYFAELWKKYQTWFLKRDLLSWLGLGIILFYSGYLPIKILRHYNDINGLIEPPYVRTIQIILVLAMYSSFILGFLFMRRRRIPNEKE